MRLLPRYVSAATKSAGSIARQRRDELAADPLELARVSSELVVGRAAPGEHLPHEDEPACVQEQVVDVMVENGCAV
jgi:hypothetical protein